MANKNFAVKNGLDVAGDVTANGGTFGNTTIGVVTDNTISTTSGDLVLDSSSNTLTINAATDITDTLTTQAGATARILNNTGTTALFPFNFETYATTTPPAAGFGGGFNFKLSNDAYVTKTAVQFYGGWTDAAAGTEDTVFNINLTSNGALQLIPQYRFYSDGKVTLGGGTLYITSSQQGQLLTYDSASTNWINSSNIAFTNNSYRVNFKSQASTATPGINHAAVFMRDRLTSNYVDNDGAGVFFSLDSNAQAEQTLGSVGATYHSTNGQSILLRPYNGAFQDCFTANRNTTIVRAENFLVENTSGTDNLTVDTSGNVVITGDLRINGNDIQCSSGASTLIMTSANTTTTLRGDTINLQTAAGSAQTSAGIGYTRTYGEFAYTNAAGFAIAAQNTIYTMPLDTTLNNSGVTIANTGDININVSGWYKIIMSLQATSTHNGVNSFQFWLRKNGSDVANSKTEVDFLKDQKSVIAMDWLVNSDGNDYWEIVYVGTTANYADIDFPTIAATATPGDAYNSPLAPALLVNVIPAGM